MTKRSFRGILLFGAALMAAGGAGAQLLPQVGALPGQVLGGVLGPGGAGNVPVVGGAVDMLADPADAERPRCSISGGSGCAR
jgi:hypothetical protein